MCSYCSSAKLALCFSLLQQNSEGCSLSEKSNLTVRDYTFGIYFGAIQVSTHSLG